VDLAGLLDYERRTQTELPATTEPICPGLAALAADLIAGWLPASPVALPWPH